MYKRAGVAKIVLQEGNQPTVLSQELLLGVVEELKLPLLQIARRAESATGQDMIAQIQAAADSALQLLDNYALGVNLALHPEQLATEAVSVSSVLYDSAHQLQGLAKNYDVELELSVSGKLGLVEVHREGLQAALVSLGAALIEALPATSGESPQLKLQLATHRSRYGVVAGLYGETKQFNQRALLEGRRLLGRSRQPLTGVSHTSGAGIFLADTILQAMNLRLTASRHHRLYGIGTVMQPNHQLQLV